MNKYEQELKEARLFARRIQRKLKSKAQSRFKSSGASSVIKVRARAKASLLDRITIEVPKHILVHQYGVAPKRVKDKVRTHTRARKGKRHRVSHFNRVRNMKIKATPIISEVLNENNELENLANKITEIKADSMVVNLNYKL